MQIKTLLKRSEDSSQNSVETIVCIIMFNKFQIISNGNNIQFQMSRERTINNQTKNKSIVFSMTQKGIETTSISEMSQMLSRYLKTKDAKNPK
jgi:hypothetical protein